MRRARLERKERMMNLDIVRAHWSLSSIRPLLLPSTYKNSSCVLSLILMFARWWMKWRREKGVHIFKRGERQRRRKRGKNTHLYIREQTGMKREKRTLLLLLQRMSLVRSMKVYKVNRREERRKERDAMKISIEVRSPLCRHIHLYIDEKKKGTERMLES